MSSHELNFAAKQRVCTKLQELGLTTALSCVAPNKTEIQILSPTRSPVCRIEVRASRTGRFLTALSQRCGADDPNSPDFWNRRASDPDAPDFWVFRYGQVGAVGKGERFYVMTHPEVCRAQKSRNDSYVDQRGGRPYDFSTGVDNILEGQLKRHENQWSKILEVVRQRAAG